MPESSRRQAKTLQKRVEILRSAAAAFRRSGYHGASMEQIADTLQMTKGSLYYYFRNKEEILYFCHDYSLDILLRLLDEVEADASPPDQRLRRLIVAFVHTILDELRGTALVLDLQALSPPLLRKIVAKRDRFDRGIRRVLQDGMERGTFAPGDAKLISFAILGAVNWITRWFDPQGPAGSEQIGQAFADYLIAGLRRPDAAEPGETAPRPAHAVLASRE